MKKFFLAAILLFTASIKFAGFVGAQTATSTPPTPPARIKIPILTYHSVRPYYPGITDLVKEYTVPPDIFDDQLKYLKDNGFTPITPDELVSYFTSGNALPPKPVMITLDDGWRNQFRYAFPILQKYHDPAVFYIYKNVVGKKVFLTWDNVKTLAKSNMVIGDHTESHPELPNVKNDADLEREIVYSKRFIEGQLGRTIDTFAYPFGEYSDQSMSVVKRAGYTSARALRGCVYQSQDILFTLCGVIITGDFNRFVATVNRP